LIEKLQLQKQKSKAWMLFHLNKVAQVQSEYKLWVDSSSLASLVQLAPMQTLQHNQNNIIEISYNLKAQWEVDHRLFKTISMDP
jgi:hypothetical protein